MEEQPDITPPQPSEPATAPQPVEGPPAGRFDESLLDSAFPALAPPFAPASGASARARFLGQMRRLLIAGLATFVLSTWIFVHADFFPGGPQQVARQQLGALSRGDVRGAYEMFSERYRGQVSFEAWRELILTHRRMFHAQVVRDGQRARAGQRVTVEMHLLGIDQKGYRARFTLLKLEGRWWVDDLHWGEEPTEADAVKI